MFSSSLVIFNELVDTKTLVNNFLIFFHLIYQMFTGLTSCYVAIDYF